MLIDAPVFTCRVPADVDELKHVRHALRHWLARQDVAEALQDDVTLAVGEACTNAIEHAYIDRDRATVLVDIAMPARRMARRDRDDGLTRRIEALDPRDQIAGLDEWCRRLDEDHRAERGSVRPQNVERVAHDLGRRRVGARQRRRTHEGRLAAPRPSSGRDVGIVRAAHDPVPGACRATRCQACRPDGATDERYPADLAQVLAFDADASGTCRHEEQDRSALVGDYVSQARTSVAIRSVADPGSKCASMNRRRAASVSAGSGGSSSAAWMSPPVLTGRATPAST